MSKKPREYTPTASANGCHGTEETHGDIPHFSGRVCGCEKSDGVRHDEGTAQTAESPHNAQRYDAAHEPGDELEEHPYKACRDHSILMSIDGTQAASDEDERSLRQTKGVEDVLSIEKSFAMVRTRVQLTDRRRQSIPRLSARCQVVVLCWLHL